MENTDFTSLDYEYFENQEAEKIPVCFRMTKLVVILFGIALTISIAYSVYKLMHIARSMDDPFTSLAFDFSFIAVILEVYIFVFVFPSLLTRKHSFLRGILISLAIISALHGDWLVVISSLWIVIIVSYYSKATENARRRYDSYLVDKREHEQKATRKEMREIYSKQ